jgi:hypothetical protein
MPSKLQGEKGTELNNDVRTRLSHISIASPDRDQDKSIELPNKTETIGNQNEQSNSKSNTKDTPKRKKLLLFTADEDMFLSAGIKSHGFGQWTAILRDPKYKFQNTSFGLQESSNKPDTFVPSDCYNNSIAKVFN